MRQSRLMSLTEAAANIMVGYAVGILTQALVFPILGIETSLRQNLSWPRFTAVSFVSSYALRGICEHV